MEINSILCLKRNLKPCRHITIQRPLGYKHHVFIGEVNPNWCDYFQYECSWKTWVTCLLTLSPPGQITKSRLYYSLHKDNRKIFNFHNGETICIVNRVDYPESKSAEYECIRRANSRVWEKEYSIVFNNCESFVNWIFSGDNTSHEYRNASLLKQMSANALDGVISTGQLFIELYIIETFCKIITCFFENKLNAQYLESTADHQNGRKKLGFFGNTTLILHFYTEKRNRCNSVHQRYFHEIFEENIMKVSLQLWKTRPFRYRNNVSSGNKMAILSVKSVVFENSNAKIWKQVANNRSSSLQHKIFRCGCCEAPNKIETSQTSSYYRHKDMTYSQSVRNNNAEIAAYIHGQQITNFNEARNCSTNGSNEINCDETNYGLFGCLIPDIDWFTSTIQAIYLTNFSFSCLRMWDLHSTRQISNTIFYERIAREAFISYAGVVGSLYGTNFIRSLSISPGWRQQRDDSCIVDSICRQPTICSSGTISIDDWRTNGSDSPIYGNAIDVSGNDSITEQTSYAVQPKSLTSKPEISRDHHSPNKRQQKDSRETKDSSKSVLVSRQQTNGLINKNNVSIKYPETSCNDAMQLNATAIKQMTNQPLCVPDDQQQILVNIIPILNALFDNLLLFAIACIVLVIVCFCINKFVKMYLSKNN